MLSQINYTFNIYIFNLNLNKQFHYMGGKKKGGKKKKKKG